MKDVRQEETGRPATDDHDLGPRRPAQARLLRKLRPKKGAKRKEWQGEYGLKARLLAWLISGGQHRAF
jgi:hypothetical protein